jgi:hypothetical protein
MDTGKIVVIAFGVIIIGLALWRLLTGRKKTEEEKDKTS